MELLEVLSENKTLNWIRHEGRQFMMYNWLAQVKKKGGRHNLLGLKQTRMVAGCI